MYLQHLAPSEESLSFLMLPTYTPFWKRLAIAVLVLLPVASAQAQERTGFGLSLQSQTLLDGSGDYLDALDVIAPTFLFSSVSAAARFEPKIGLVRVARETSSSTIVQLGLGGFREHGREETSLYYGARVGVAFSTGGGEPIGSIGPVIGGTHRFGGHFALGAEVEVRYARPLEGGVSILRTSPALVVRYYM